MTSLWSLSPRRSDSPSSGEGRCRRALAIGLWVVAIDHAAKGLAPVYSASPLVEPLENPALLMQVASPPWLLSLTLGFALLLAFGSFAVRCARRGLIEVWVAGALLGGATANLVDRLFFGAVRDFISTPWLVFNFADVVLLVGVVAFIWQAARGRLDSSSFDESEQRPEYTSAT